MVPAAYVLRKWPVSASVYPSPMPNPSVAGAAVLAESWAEVRANDQVVRYRRSGAGRAPLLLLCSLDREPLWPRLVEAVGASFRVITPEPPAADADVACWLGSFLEGLGLRNVAILAADRFCIPVLELAFLGLDQITRIVLVPDGQGSRDEARGVLETATRQAALPLLVVRRGQPTDDVLPLIADFLNGKAATNA